MNRAVFIVLAMVLVAGCASGPQEKRGASISEIGERAQSENPEDHNIDDVPTYYEWDDEPDYHGDEPGSTISWWFTDEDEAYARGHDRRRAEEPMLLDTNKVWLERRFANPPSRSFYQTEPTWGLGFTSFDDNLAIGGSVYFAQARFTTTQGESLEDAFLLGFQLDASARKPLTDQVTLGFGGGVTWALLGWQYDNPLQDGNDEITGDALGSFGFVLPLGVESRHGPVVTELTVTPTLRFYGDHSDSGFTNDLGRVSSSLPVALRLGIVF